MDNVWKIISCVNRFISHTMNTEECKRCTIVSCRNQLSKLGGTNK